MTYNQRELEFHKEAQELRKQARRLQSMADKGMYQRQKAAREARERREADQLAVRWVEFAGRMDLLKRDFEMCVPIGYRCRIDHGTLDHSGGSAILTVSMSMA